MYDNALDLELIIPTTIEELVEEMMLLSLIIYNAYAKEGKPNLLRIVSTR